MFSEVLSGNQEALRGHQTQSEAIKRPSRGTPRPFEVIRRTPPPTIRGNQRQSEAIRGNQDALLLRQVLLELLEIFELRQKPFKL